MIDPMHPIHELLRKDRRYPLDAYAFVFEALSYAQSVLKMGKEAPPQPGGEEDEPERHVTGQELCEAIRRFALEQYGYMAQTVLNNWGIRRTGDFGEIVFNLIATGQMRKTHRDRREDFDDVYDFDAAFEQEFRIAPQE